MRLICSTTLQPLRDRSLANQLQILAAMTFSGFIRDRAAIAIRATADIFALQSDHLHRLSTAALARVAFAALTAALSAAPAKNSSAFLYREDMHLSQLRTALAFARLVGDKIAFAIVFAVADVVDLVLISRDKHANNREKKQYRGRCDDCFFHAKTPFP